jgi:hypothetical protein
VPFPLETKPVTNPVARFLKDSHGPFTGDQRLVVRADDDPASLADGIENKFFWRDAHRADNGSGIAQGL